MLMTCHKSLWKSRHIPFLVELYIHTFTCESHPMLMPVNRQRVGVWEWVKSRPHSHFRLHDHPRIEVVSSVLPSKWPTHQMVVKRFDVWRLELNDMVTMMTLNNSDLFTTTHPIIQQHFDSTKTTHSAMEIEEGAGILSEVMFFWSELFFFLSFYGCEHVWKLVSYCCIYICVERVMFPN